MVQIGVICMFKKQVEEAHPSLSHSLTLTLSLALTRSLSLTFSVSLSLLLSHSHILSHTLFYNAGGGLGIGSDDIWRSAIHFLDTQRN